MKKNIFTLALLFCFISSNAKTDKYRLSIRTSPATSIVVCWNQISGNSPIVYFGKKDYGTDFSKYKNKHTPDRAISFKGMNNHFARLENLSPNTAYYFIIKDSESTSKRYWFKTAPDTNKKLSFIAGGDSRNNRLPRQQANIIVSKLKPHAVLFGGDMTSGDNDKQWNTWMDDWQLTTATDGRMFPIITTRGNHERSNESIYNLFDTPSSKVYYALTFGKDLIRTYTLNSEISIKGQQTKWLKKDLKQHNTIWKSAQYHRPMRPHVANKPERNIQYASWAKLFYDEDVRLVVECDAHTVKTTWPLKPSTGTNSSEGFIREDKKGTVYVGEGCWGAPLRPNNDIKPWTRNSGKFNQVKWIFVSKKKIECRTIIVANAKEVTPVTNKKTFKIPSNLKIWTPSNGPVVIIKKN